MNRRAVVWVAVLALAGCFPTAGRPPEGVADKPSGEENQEPPPERKRDEFASDRGGGGQPPAPVSFDADRAMDYLKEVCKIGPRISGTDGMKKQQELLRKHFEAHGATVTLQEFTARQNSQRPKPVPMANLIASWHPDRQRRVIICSHYDTRPIADQEPNRRDWTKPFISANDGGSGVAFLMELAHHVKGLKAQVGVDFVLFDGEEYIFEPDHDKYFFGSEHFAGVYRSERGKKRYLGAVLLDMIAGKGARFPVEQNSWLKAGGLVQDLWRIAGDQKCRAFVNDMQSAVLDDHIALNAAGIPTVDLIDFSYRHWHRLSDVPENCSGEGMEQVARVVTVWLQRAK